MRLTLEEKLKNVKLHLFENVTIHDIWIKYGQNDKSLKYCVKLYKRWGEKAFKKENERNLYTREIKLKAIQDVLMDKKSFREVAIELMLNNLSSRFKDKLVGSIKFLQ